MGGTLMEVMATDIGTEKEVLMLNQALMPMLTMVTGVTGTATLTMVTDMAITWVSEALMPKLTPNLTMVTGPVMVTDILIMVTDMAIIWANEVLMLMPNLMPMATIPAITDIPIAMAMAGTMAVTGAKLTDHFSLLTLILITLISEHKKSFVYYL